MKLIQIQTAQSCKYITEKSWQDSFHVNVRMSYFLKKDGLVGPRNHEMDHRFRSDRQLGLGRLLELEMQWLVCTIALPLLLWARGREHLLLFYLLKHILATKVDAEHIPNAKVNLQEK